MRKYQNILNCKSLVFLIGLFLLGIIDLNAQSLSPAGHIIIPNRNNLDYEVIMHENQMEIKYQEKKFKGNTLFETAFGFLSSNANYENAPAELFFYTGDAKLLHKKTYAQCINLQVSENKQYLAFYNAGFIHTLNLQNFTEQKFQGTSLFSINNNGQLSYVHNNFIYVDDAVINAPSALISIKNMNEQWYYICKTGIYVYADDAMHKVYTPKQGIIFDVEIVNNQWYISTRTKSNTQYQYFLHSLSSFQTETVIETKTYKRVYATKDAPEKIDPKFNNRNNELIKNPMDFFSAESYQAIGNSYNEIQEYSPGSTYLHPGVDLFGEHLENVHSVKAGYVKAVLTTSGDFHWRVAIANNNSSNDSSQGYLYAHLEEPLIPVLVGDTVAEGEVIGQLVDFPVTGFVHCHFARIVDRGPTWSGNWWTFDDPLFYMTNFRDTSAPVFEECITGQKFAFRDAIGDYLSSENVYGEVDIISNVHDLINTFWKVDVYKIGYHISPVNSPKAINYNEYSFDFNMFNDTYFNGPYVQDIINTMYSRDATCFSTGNYDDRFFYHILSNSNGDDTITTADAEQNLNTTLYPNGDYMLTVWAIDAAGNTSADSMLFTIDNFVGIHTDKKNNFSIHPNPSTGIYHLKNTSGKASLVKVMDIMGKEMKSFHTEGLFDSFDLSELPKGMYLLRFEEGASVKVLKN